MSEKSMTRAEWQVMRVIWAYPNSRSSQVIERLERDFFWKPATIKTLLNRLKSKEYLSMTKKEGKFYYQALLTEEAHLQSEWQDLLANTCQTKHGSFLLSILEDSQLSQSDWDKLIDLAEKKRSSAPEHLSCQCPSGQCRCGHTCHREKA